MARRSVTVDGKPKVVRVSTADADDEITLTVGDEDSGRVVGLVTKLDLVHAQELVDELVKLIDVVKKRGGGAAAP